MRVHCLQHVLFEGPALIGVWARERHHPLTASMALTEEFPDLDSVDWLVIMGGPMAADDDAGHPWLAAEKRYIAEAIHAGRMVLGVCLGAQIVAEVIGGEVCRNPEREIGWWPIRVLERGRSSPVFGVLPDEFVAMSWHSDTFTLPPGVQTAMSSEACANQAFEFATRVWGLQFHLEWDEDALGEIVRHCGAELTGGRYVQATPQLWAGPERFGETRRTLWRLLDAMELVGPASMG